MTNSNQGEKGIHLRALTMDGWMSCQHRPALRKLNGVLAVGGAGLGGNGKDKANFLFQLGGG